LGTLAKKISFEISLEVELGNFGRGIQLRNLARKISLEIWPRHLA